MGLALEAPALGEEGGEQGGLVLRPHHRARGNRLGLREEGLRVEGLELVEVGACEGTR